MKDGGQNKGDAPGQLSATVLICEPRLCLRNDLVNGPAMLKMISNVIFDLHSVQNLGIFIVDKMGFSQTLIFNTSSF